MQQLRMRLKIGGQTGVEVFDIEFSAVFVGQCVGVALHPLQLSQFLPASLAPFRCVGLAHFRGPFWLIFMVLLPRSSFAGILPAR